MMPDFGLLQGGTQLNPNAFGSGLSQGAGLVQLQQAAQDRQTALAEKQAAVEAAKAKAVEDAKRNMYQMERFDEVRKNPTTDAIEKLALEFPQQAESLLKVHKSKSEREQKENIGIATRAQAAFRSGQPQIGQQILEEAAAAREAQGDADSAKGLRQIAETSKKDLGAATLTTGMFLSAAMAQAGMSFKDTFQAIETADADKQKAQAEADIKRAQADTERDKRLEEIMNSKAQREMWKNQTGVAWARLGLDREEFNQRVDEAKQAREDKQAEMPDAIRKVVDAAVIDGTAATMQAEEIEDIVKGWEEYDRPGNLSASGARAAANEAIKSFFGSQDKVSALRKRTDALVNKLVVTNLPPGAASENDVKMVKGGFPDQYAPPEEKAAFLKSLGKVQRAVAQQKAIEADYQSQNFGLTNAKRDLVIDGVIVPAGTPYRKASEMVFKAKKKAAETAGALQDGDNE